MTRRATILGLIAGLLAAGGCGRVTTTVPEVSDNLAGPPARAVAAEPTPAAHASEPVARAAPGGSAATAAQAAPRVVVRAQAADAAREVAPSPALAEATGETAPRARAAPAKEPGAVEQPAPGAAPAPEPARPAADRVSEVLNKLLAPPTGPLPRASAVAGTAPRAVSGPARLEHPPAWLPPSPGGPPRLPAVRLRVPLRPWPVAEGMPLADQRGTPRPPAEVVLAAGERARVAGPNVAVPPALTPTPQPVPDRAALDDPTAEFSITSARATVPPDRSAMAPFAPRTLPDPFELRKAVQMKATPPDDGDPVTAVARPPRK